MKNNDSKYRIFQVQENDSLSKKSCINNKYTELDDVSGVVKTHILILNFVGISTLIDWLRLHSMLSFGSWCMFYWLILWNVVGMMISVMSILACFLGLEGKLILSL